MKTVDIKASLLPGRTGEPGPGGLVLGTLGHPPGAPYDIASCLPYLDPDERARAGRFVRERDAWSYAAAHALLRLLLARLHGRPPLAWRFAAGPHGKPEVVAVDAACPILVNLSHTHDLVACLVSRGPVPPGTLIGVDVECTERPSDTESLARHYFHEAERSALSALGPAARTRAFFHLWTLKEAAVKALGLGLTMSFESFACGLDPPRLAGPAAPFGPAEAWELRTWPAGDRHVMATAVRAAAGQRLGIEPIAWPTLPG